MAATDIPAPAPPEAPRQGLRPGPLEYLTPSTKKIGILYLYTAFGVFFAGGIGHPEVYIIILPVFGIISEVTPVLSRKPLFGYRAMVFATFLIAGYCFTVWPTTPSDPCSTCATARTTLRPAATPIHRRQPSAASIPWRLQALDHGQVRRSANGPVSVQGRSYRPKSFAQS